MKKFFKGLLFVLLIAAAGLGYLSYKTDKPMIITSNTKFIDLFNHVGSPTKSEHYDNGTSMVQYEVAEDQVFKIIHQGYPKRIKLYKFYTLTLYFDDNGYNTSYQIKENPNSPLLGKNK